MLEFLNSLNPCIASLMVPTQLYPCSQISIKTDNFISNNTNGITKKFEIHYPKVSFSFSRDTIKDIRTRHFLCLQQARGSRLRLYLKENMNLMPKVSYRLLQFVLVATYLITCCFGAIGKETSNKPNIIFILADDLGWNDVDWHDPTLHSPNLNTLAHGPHSVRLHSAYVNQLCSPCVLAFYYHPLCYAIGCDAQEYWFWSRKNSHRPCKRNGKIE